MNPLIQSKGLYLNTDYKVDEDIEVKSDPNRIRQIIYNLVGNSFNLYDLTSDEDSNEEFRYESGTQLWIKFLVAPTIQTSSSNAVYCVAVYGKGE